MLRPNWARLAQPFSTSARAWALLELAPDRTTARVAPRLSAGSIRARLDEAVGPGEWSVQLLPLGDYAIVCNLTVEGVTRAAVYGAPRGIVAGSPLASAESLADTALSLAAEQFGMVAGGSEEWVDHDPDTGEVLIVEQDGEAFGERSAAATSYPTQGSGPSPEAAGVVAPEAAAGATADIAAEVPSEAPVDERPESHLVIDRLVDRLKAEGLGPQAAKLVVRYGGYGRTPEESRELYGKLRALLMGKVAVPS